ncbi:hypothetical protein SAMN05216343_11084 [Oscillibacter sp. PC13]|uniref:hypothetical protein n=1 Tax=Oscillibacter sp. PC13 TaxID=1855299 RepID=UPI0008E07123|nr:hypothetical protein [Oscillibacter sp. PC13]SFP61477.1 hypothetical protein SAMN05216343_11084 [Oscillibacter sp. PC13]
MKKYLYIPMLTLAGTAAAFLLWFLFCRTGFEPDTGLPISGNLYGYLFLGLLAVLAVLFLIICKQLPDEREFAPSFSTAFSTSSPALLTVPVAGLFLLAASGLFDLYSGFLVNASRAEIIAGVLTAISAAALFPAVTVCRRHSSAEAPHLNSSNMLLVPVCCLVVRLVLTYRTASINPSLSSYYVEILALVFLTLGFYRLSSFAFQAGRTRRFALYVMPAVVLCGSALAGGHDISSALLYAGGAVTLLGFLLLRLDAMSAVWNHNDL